MVEHSPNFLTSKQTATMFTQETLSFSCFGVCVFVEHFNIYMLLEVIYSGGLGEGPPPLFKQLFLKLFPSCVHVNEPMPRDIPLFRPP